MGKYGEKHLAWAPPRKPCLPIPHHVATVNDADSYWCRLSVIVAVGSANTDGNDRRVIIIACGNNEHLFRKTYHIMRVSGGSDINSI